MIGDETVPIRRDGGVWMELSAVWRACLEEASAWLPQMRTAGARAGEVIDGLMQRVRVG